MANNVAVTPGSGVNIASDEVTFSGETAQVQYMKLMDGTEDSVNAAVVDADGNVHTIESGLRTAGDNIALTLAFGAWTKAAVTGTTMAARKSLLVFNDSDVRIRATFNNARGVTDGIPIPSGQAMPFDGALDVWLQPESGSGKIAIVAEVS